LFVGLLFEIIVLGGLEISLGVLEK